MIHFGYGVVAYFKILEHLAKIFAVLSIFALGLILIFKYSNDH
jgi:hypothetical protein